VIKKSVIGSAATGKPNQNVNNGRNKARQG